MDAPRRITPIPQLPDRPADAHKGVFGRVLIVAGSRGMSGAACLAGLGALRGGAGLVYLAVPQGIVGSVAAAEPSYLTVPLPEDEQGRLSSDAHEVLFTQLDGYTTVAVGPGLGQSDAMTALIRRLYTSASQPMVVDADGLNALVNCPEVLGQAPAPRILTPHPGEFARLTGTAIGDVQQQREQSAAQFAGSHGVVLVLKGQGTVVTDGDRIAVNSTGNSGMATGGTGDVLTGLIAALSAQGMTAFDAARLGVHLHGLAGDIAARSLSQPGMIASDIAAFLPSAWNQMEG